MKERKESKVDKKLQTAHGNWAKKMKNFTWIVMMQRQDLIIIT